MHLLPLQLNFIFIIFTQAASLFVILSWRIGVMVSVGMITAMAGSFMYMGYEGSSLNLLRWVSPRTIKENFLPPVNYRYPYMQE